MLEQRFRESFARSEEFKSLLETCLQSLVSSRITGTGGQGLGAAAAEAWQSLWSRCRGWRGEFRSSLGSELSPSAGILPSSALHRQEGFTSPLADSLQCFPIVSFSGRRQFQVLLLVQLSQAEEPQPGSGAEG